MLFDRDIQCIRNFFQKRFNYVSVLFPTFAKSIITSSSDKKLDVDVLASGFSKTLQGELEAFQQMEAEQADEEEGFNNEEPEDESDEEEDQGVQELDQQAHDDELARVLAEIQAELEKTEEADIPAEKLSNVIVEEKKQVSFDTLPDEPQSQELTPSSSEIEQQEPEDEEISSNKTYKPFRDASSIKTPSSLLPNKKDAAPRTVPPPTRFTPEEIRQRVSKGMKGNNSFTNLKISKRNRVKKGEARNGKDSIKYGGEGWD